MTVYPVYRFEVEIFLLIPCTHPRNEHYVYLGASARGGTRIVRRSRTVFGGTCVETPSTALMT